MRTRNVVIVAGCLIALITFGARTSFGLFTEPLSALRGWDRETFALAIAIQNLLWGVGQPFAGAVADRYGAGRVLAAGGAVYALGVALMAVSTSPATLALTGGVLVGLGLSGGSFTIVIAAFARLVPEDRRSWAMGLATAMGSLGQFVFAPLGQGFIGAYGPATALALIGGCVALVPVLAVALRSGGDGAEDGTQESSSVAIRDALAHPSYLLLTSGFFVCGFHIAFVSTHLPPYLTDLGLGTALAAWALALIGLFNVVGAYTAGVLGGHVQPAAAAERDLRLARRRLRALRRAAGHPGDGAAVRRRDRAAVALDRPAHLGPDRRHVRHPPPRPAVRHRVPQPPGRRVRRRLARRRRLRRDRRLRPHVVGVDRARLRRRARAPADRRAARAATGGEPGMTRRMRELLVGVAITLVAFAGVYWQAEQPGEAGELPRLVCPLH